MRPIPTVAVLSVLLLATAGCDTGSDVDQAEVVQTAPLDDAGTATLDGDDIIVELAGGPVRLTPADDTTFFVCVGEDCEIVDEDDFRAQVGDGDSIRVLGPNAELLTPDADQLPEQLWVVLDRDAD